MKNLFFTIVFLMLALIAFCQGGIHFEQLTFDEALVKAKAENKLVFMDCYTSWCGPCKMMEKEIFPQKKVGEFFNPKFISIKIDMEKGEGPELRKRFDVKAYPTFLIIRPDGSLQHKATSSREESDEFIATIAKGLKEKTSYDYLTKQ